MSRLGLAAGAALGIVGILLMVLGYSAVPAAMQPTVFMAGAILLGAAGIALAIAGLGQAAAAPAPSAAASPSSYPAPARVGPNMRYRDPFVTPARNEPGLTTPVATGATAAAGAAAGLTETYSSAEPDYSQQPEPVASEQPPMQAETASPEPIAAETAVSEPAAESMFNLPPLRPRQTIADKPSFPDFASRAEARTVQPVAPVVTSFPEVESTAIEDLLVPTPPIVERPGTNIAAEPVLAEVEASPAAIVQDPPLSQPAFHQQASAPVASPTPDADIDPFDLEAAIAAELGVSSFSDRVEPVTASQPVPEATEPPPSEPMEAEPRQIEVDEPPPVAHEPMAEEAQTEIQEESYQEPAPAESPLVEQAEAPSTESSVVLGSYESAGVLYTLYEDGSVTAEADGVKQRYDSLDALRAAFDSTPA